MVNVVNKKKNKTFTPYKDPHFIPGGIKIMIVLCINVVLYSLLSINTCFIIYYPLQFLKLEF